MASYIHYKQHFRELFGITEIEWFFISYCNPVEITEQASILS